LIVLIIYAILLLEHLFYSGEYHGSLFSTNTAKESHTLVKKHIRIDSTPKSMPSAHRSRINRHSHRTAPGYLRENGAHSFTRCAPALKCAFHCRGGLPGTKTKYIGM